MGLSGRAASLSSSGAEHTRTSYLEAPADSQAPLLEVLARLVTDLVTKSPETGEKHATQCNHSETPAPDELHK